MKSPDAQTGRIALALLVLLTFFISSTPRVPAGAAAAPEKKKSGSDIAPAPDMTKMRVAEAYGKLPLSFEPNRGQTDRDVRFLSRGEGYTLFLTSDEAILSLKKSGKRGASGSQTRQARREAAKPAQALLRMKLVGANPAAQVSGENELQGKNNYLIGNDRKKWRTDIPTFSRVRYEGVYPGTDLIYYGTNQRQLEYDFILKPGADPRAIALRFEGADRISIDDRGDLLLETKAGQIVQRAPVIYQKTSTGKQMVDGRYVMKAEREIGFEVAEYDHSRELVIDPQLLYATFYGGSDFDTGDGIAVDGSGNAYITGTTLSSGLSLKSAYDGNFSDGGGDAYVVKLNPTGTDIVYATYLGGSITSEGGDAIAITSDGKACVTGSVNSVQHNSDFPITSNAYQGNPSIFNSHGVNAFVTVLAPGGNGLVYSTFFGGSNASSPIDAANGIAVDAANRIYITGDATTSNFPTKNAFQNSRSGFRDAFIAKFDPTQSGNSSLVYSSYLGGSGSEFGNAIAVTPGGVAFIVGVTGSFNYPTKSSSSLPAFQTIQGGVNDSFIAKVSPSGALIYSTFFGGNDRDEAQSVAVDSDERAYVTGFTLSNAATFPLKNAFQPNRIGSAQDAFVAKFNADGTALFYSSFLGGGTINNTGGGIAVDAAGNAYVTGTSVVFSPSLTVNGFPPSVPNGGGLVAKIEASDATGTTIPKILYMDGFSTAGNGIAVDPRGNVYIVGTNSGGMPTTPGAFQETYNGGSTDATVARIGSTFPDTIGVFHPPTTSQFQLRNSNTAGPPDLTANFGQAGDQALAGDWDGDGVDNVGVFRSSTAQFLLRQPTRIPPTNTLITVTRTINFGQAGDKAVVGDWNGDGIDTPGVFRNGQFLLTNSPNTPGSTPPIDLIFNFGQAGDLPVAGDWNGDGIDTVGVFRCAGDCSFTLTNNNSSIDIVAAGFGTTGEVPPPVVGDWNGDGVDSLGIFSPGLGNKFFLTNTNATLVGQAEIQFFFGQATDLPLAGDWDGAPPSNVPPNSGINSPSDGSSRVNQTQIFTTTCSDPNGWHDIATIDFKVARSDGNGNGVPLALWVQFDENQNRIRFYNPDSQTWSEGTPGSNVVLSSRFADLYLEGTHVQGSGPTGPGVQVTWEVVFKDGAIMNNYKQYLQITDDAGLTTGFDKVGSWSVTR